MARARRRHQNHRDRIVSPRLSLRLVVVLTACFVALIATFFVVGKLGFRRSSFWVEDKKFFRNVSEIPHSTLSQLDAILVLGGGKPTSLEEPPIYVQRRCDDAAAVVKRRQEKASTSKPLLPILCLSAGTAHLPQLMGPDGLPIWESTSSAAYLARQHGLSNNVFVETTSYDTIGNAFFARTSHTDIAGWKRLLIITNEFHMDRTKAIFDWIFGLDAGSSDLFYLQSENVGLSSEALHARSKKERKSLNNVQAFAKRYRSRKSVWEWINTQHDLYTANKLIERGRSKHNQSLSAEVKMSYGAS